MKPNLREVRIITIQVAVTTALILSTVLLGGATVSASEMVVADFKSADRERIIVSQRTKEYGLDLVIVKHDGKHSKKEKVKTVRNAFGVVLNHPSTILLCSIQNGTNFDESFQVLDIGTFKSKLLTVEPLPTSDVIECLIEESEKYFLIFDNFPGRETAYLFNKNGEFLRNIPGDLQMKIEIDGKIYSFVRGHEFGGFTFENNYIPKSQGKETVN